jgi:hypothetical protein
LNYTLTGDLLNLTLTGTSAIYGTGNSSANIITANSLNDILNGGGGNDTFVGGAGNDTIIGGTGACTCTSVFNDGDGIASVSIGTGGKMINQINGISDSNIAIYKDYVNNDYVISYDNSINAAGNVADEIIVPINSTTGLTGQTIYDKDGNYINDIQLTKIVSDIVAYEVTNNVTIDSVASVVGATQTNAFGNSNTLLQQIASDWHAHS